MAYQKQVWREYDDTKTELQNALNGALATPERLNHIENGIANSADKAEVTAQLQHKADQAFVDSQFSTIVSGAPKGTYTDLRSLQSAYPSGAEGVFLVLSDGHWYYWNGTTSAWIDGGVYQGKGIGYKTVLPQELQGTVQLNLLDSVKVLTGLVANSTGVIVSNAAFSVTDLIPVLPSEKITLSIIKAHTHVVVYYDVDKKFLSTEYRTVTTTKTVITVPSSAKYMRVNILNTDFPNYEVIRGSLETDIIPSKINWLVLDDETVAYAHLDNFLKKNLLFDRVNLLNPETIKTGFVVVAQHESVNATWSVSDYIPVKSSSKYTVSDAYFKVAAFFDANKNFISVLDVAQGGKNYVIDTPENAKFMRVNIENTRLTDYMVVEGAAMPDTFMAYSPLDGSLLKNNTVRINSFTQEVLDYMSNKSYNKWAGKTITAFGDSITWYDGQTFFSSHIEYGQTVKGYLSYVRERLGTTVVNQGVSGNTLPMINNRIKQHNFAGVDAVTINGGINDFSVGTAVGTIQPIGSIFDNTTSIGAIQESIEYILGVNPEIKIYLLTPIKGWHNEKGAMPDTLPNLIKEIGDLYSIGVCDLYSESGINELTKNVYLGDGAPTGYKVHPTNKGFERMGDIIVSFLETH